MRAGDVPMAEAHPARQTEDLRFMDLFTRLKPHGGMVSDDELRCLHTVSRPGLSLGMALLQRELVALKWRHRLWLPLFQFQLPAWSALQPVVDIVHELHPVFQGFELVEWFITPNPWLRERLPIDLLEREPTQVQRAAQADRFLITF